MQPVSIYTQQMTTFNPDIINLSIEPQELQYETDEQYLHLVHRIFCITPVAVSSQTKAGEEKQEQKEQKEEREIDVRINESEQEDEEEELEKEIEESDIIHKFLDHVEEITRGKPYWHELYLKAAATFMSEDPGIGLPVLLSYSYLPLFYRLLQLESKGRQHTAQFDVLYNELFSKFVKDSSNPIHMDLNNDTVS